jgi:Zn-dependent peptidase ImmA (M78 family)
MSQALPFNPDVLRWARTRSRLPIEAAAKRVNTSAERVREWEDPEGLKRPTLRQARMLAALYGRPFLEFFAKAVPEVPKVELAPDFRFHRTPPTEIESAALDEIHRWAEEQRLNALGLLEILNEKPPAFPEKLRASLQNKPEEVAKNAREQIGFSIESQLRLKAAEREDFPDIIRKIFSDIGVLVLKQSDLKKARTRGVCLYAKPLPVIIFGNEASSAQAFTLAHELAHVILKESALSIGRRFKSENSEGKRIENWCNAFSAAFLIPKDALAKIVAKPASPAASFDDADLSEVADRFSVSRHALLIRLIDLGYVRSSYYWDVKRFEFIQEEKEYEFPQMRPPYYGSRYKNRLGNYYTTLVLEAWENNLISGHNAAEFMGIKNLRHLDDIRKNFS